MQITIDGTNYDIYEISPITENDTENKPRGFEVSIHWTGDASSLFKKPCNLVSEYINLSGKILFPSYDGDKDLLSFTFEENFLESTLIGYKPGYDFLEADSTDHSVYISLNETNQTTIDFVPWEIGPYIEATIPYVLNYEEWPDCYGEQKNSPLVPLIKEPIVHVTEDVMYPEYSFPIEGDFLRGLPSPVNLFAQFRGQNFLLNSSGQITTTSDTEGLYYTEKFSHIFYSNISIFYIDDPEDNTYPKDEYFAARLVEHESGVVSSRPGIVANQESENWSYAGNDYTDGVGNVFNVHKIAAVGAAWDPDILVSLYTELPFIEGCSCTFNNFYEANCVSQSGDYCIFARSKEKKNLRPTKILTVSKQVEAPWVIPEGTELMIDHPYRDLMITTVYKNSYSLHSIKRPKGNGKYEEYTDYTEVYIPEDSLGFTHPQLYAIRPNPKHYFLDVEGLVADFTAGYYSPRNLFSYWTDGAEFVGDSGTETLCHFRLDSSLEFNEIAQEICQQNAYSIYGNRLTDLQNTSVDLTLSNYDLSADHSLIIRGYPEHYDKVRLNITTNDYDKDSYKKQMGSGKDRFDIDYYINGSNQDEILTYWYNLLNSYRKELEFTTFIENGVPLHAIIQINDVIGRVVSKETQLKEELITYVIRGIW